MLEVDFITDCHHRQICRLHGKQGWKPGNKVKPEGCGSEKTHNFDKYICLRRVARSPFRLATGNVLFKVNI